MKSYSPLQSTIPSFWDTLEEQLTSIQEQDGKINAEQRRTEHQTKGSLDSKSDELSALYLENQKLLDEAEQNEAEAQAEAERLEKEKKRPMRPLINGTKTTTPR